MERVYVTPAYLSADKLRCCEQFNSIALIATIIISEGSSGDTQVI